MASSKEQYQRWVKQAPVSNNYPDAYNFHLITSIDELVKVLSNQFNVIAFDTETTGLNLDEAQMVGYSFCFNDVDCYYVPVNHAPYEELIKQEIMPQEFIQDNSDYIYDEETNKYYKVIDRITKDDSLGEQAVKIFYNRAIMCEYSLMFNCRFDIRVFERYGFYEHKDEIMQLLTEKLGRQATELDFFTYIDENQVCPITNFDMSKLKNIIDVQALVFDSDTNVPYPNLKGSEEYFLGWRGASFKDTLGSSETFYYLKPSECYIYAATDALGTFLLGERLWDYYLEPSRRTRYKFQCIDKNGFKIRHSGQLDNEFLYPLMMMEDELTQVDVDMMKSYSKYYEEKQAEIETELYQIAGGPFNYSSPKQKNEVFKKLGIVILDHDGDIAMNKRGEYKADKEHLNMAIAKLPEGDSKRKLMQDLLDIATIVKQKGTYADNFIKFCENSHYGNRLRFGYKTMVVPSGRLAAGGDKKNQFFADSNIQNITKPHIGMCYYVKYDDLIKVIPELEGKYENARQEYFYNGEKTYKILDWVFKESVWKLDGVKEWKIEGFEQKLNIRSGFTPDDDKYWVSCDFSAQELRVPALLTREPGWCHVFENNGDLHEHMAKVIWGEENYDKQKRKRAKKCNFGILYGMTARNFAIDFEISMEEAQKIVDDYKGGAPVLFNWVHDNEEMTKRTGVTNTMFGRPRRLGWYLSKERDRGMQNFGIRSCTNTVIQGTGADILKMSFLNIYEKFYNNPETRNINRKYIKFMNTVHDEINYNVSKKNIRQIVPMIISCMRLWLEDWDFPMQVGLDIGTRWGQTVAFEYDINPYIKFGGTTTQQRYSKMSDQEAISKNIHGLQKYYADPNGEYIKNSNYLHIIGPAGDEVTEEDYKPKEKKVEEKLVLVDEPEDTEEAKMFDNLY